MMSRAAAVIATLVLAGLAVLQALVAAGRPYGRFVWGGRHETLPTGLRIGSAVSIVLYLAIAAVLIARSTGPGSTFVRVAAWVICAYMVLGTGLNAISRSPSERTVIAPLVGVLAVCALIIARD